MVKELPKYAVTRKHFFRFQSLKLRGLIWLLKRFALLIRVLSERSNIVKRDPGCNDGDVSCCVSFLPDY